MILKQYPCLHYICTNNGYNKKRTLSQNLPPKRLRQKCAKGHFLVCIRTGPQEQKRTTDERNGGERGTKSPRGGASDRKGKGGEGRERVNVAIAHFPRGSGDAMANEDQHPSARLTCRQCRLM